MQQNIFRIFKHLCMCMYLYFLNMPKPRIPTACPTAYPAAANKHSKPTQKLLKIIPNPRFITFWSHFVALGATHGTRIPKNAAEGHPRTTKVIPKYSQGSPMDSQSAPKGSPRDPKGSQREPQDQQNTP